MVWEVQSRGERRVKKEGSGNFFTLIVNIFFIFDCIKTIFFRNLSKVKKLNIGKTNSYCANISDKHKFFFTKMVTEIFL